MGLLDTARARLRKSAGNAWRWAKSAASPKTRMRRWKALWKVAKLKAKNAKDAVAWGARKRVYRKRYLAQKQRVKENRRPTFEGWMANGYPYSGLNSSLRSAIAVGVIQFDCYVTSTKRNWGTTSYHEVWKAVDMAGKLMVAFQRWLVTNRPGALEIFGPDNDFFVKNGSRYTAAEGDGNESLHDNHTHYADD